MDANLDATTQLEHDALIEPWLAMRNNEEARYDLLTTREHLIGLEEELGVARQRASDLEHTLNVVRKELIETHAHLAAAIKDAQTAWARVASAEGAAQNQQNHENPSPSLSQSRSLTMRLRHRVGNILRKLGLK